MSEEAPVTATNGANGEIDMDMAEMAAQATSLDSPPPNLTQAAPAGIQASTGAQRTSAAPAPFASGQTVIRSQTMPPGSSSYEVNLNNKCSGEGASGVITTRPPPSGDINARLDSIRSWSVNTYKCTRQILSERLGRSARTVDADLETQIELLRDEQRRYRQLHVTVQGLTTHFSSMMSVQRGLTEQLAELGQRSPDMVEEFSYNAETQRVLCRNGDQLIAALGFFLKTLETLINHTMEDTLTTIRKFERARVEFDAYKTDMETLASAPPTTGDPLRAARTLEAKQKYDHHRTKYERLRDDVQVKIRFLDENKNRVMQKQLLLFHNAISAYFSGNQKALDSTMKQFNIQLKTGNSEPPSWLERE